MNRSLPIVGGLREISKRFAQSAVIWIWAVTALRLANFLFVLPIALRALPSELLGLWYLMLNVVGLVTLVEFGLSAAVSRQGTFFWAGAGEVESKGTLGEPNSNALRGLVALASKIYGRLAWAALAGCLAGGAWLAYLHPETMLKPAPLGAYALLVGAGVLRMRGLFWNPLLFGLQRVRESQRVQFTGILLSYVVSLGGLLLGGKLLALAAGQALLLLYPLYRSKWLVAAQIPDLFTGTSTAVSWRPIWAATWRAGATVLGSWLSTYGLVFACGQTVGLSTSASYALSNLVAFTMHFAAQSWLLARYPTISAMWAAGDRPGIARLAGRRILLCMATFIAAAPVAWLVLPYLLRLVGSKTPALPGLELAALFAVAGLDLFVGLHSSVLTSCNLFPHLRVMLGAGLVTLAAAFLLGSLYGVFGILAAPFLCQGFTTAWAVPLQCWRILRKDGVKVSDIAPVAT